MAMTKNKKVKASLQDDWLIKIWSETIYERDFEIEIEDDEKRVAADITKFKSIYFGNCLMLYFPSARCLSKLVTNLESLQIWSSKLSSIKANDLYGFKDLVQLNLDFNEIEELPGDLFVCTPNLQRISIAHNKIKVIDADILNALRNLKFFNLNGNPGIDICYSAKWRETTGMFVSLAHFKEAIKRCKPFKELWNTIDELKRENEELKKTNADQNIRIDGIEKNNETLKKDLDKLKECGAYQKFDFTIKVDGKEFKVQKELLIANSPLLAKMIRDNEDADTLELKDITEGTFEEILNFMHSKQPPKPTANIIELYAASGRLQMKELMDLCAKKLMDNVTPENAFEIFALCKKFPNIELQKKAHAEYGKSLNQ